MAKFGNYWLLKRNIEMDPEINNEKKQIKTEPGLYIGVGVALGAGVGSAIGVALGNIALGIGVGIAIGVAIGAGLEGQRKNSESDDLE